MENLQYIFLFLLLVTIASLAVALRKKSKEVEKLNGELTRFKGQSEDELFSRSKFSELGLMSAGITHEISNPLSIIMGRISQLQRREMNPEAKKGLEQININAERIASIIRSVREYIYRNDEQEEEYISLKDIINNVLVFYGQRLKNHGIELRLKNIENVYVSGHRGLLDQALINLISNSFDAIDHLKEKWIEVSAKKIDDKVQIAVTDSGLGIPSEVRSHILEPFFTTKKNKGSGLGLALVKGIAEKHGGDLKYVENEHTTFMLELPQANSLQYH